MVGIIIINIVVRFDDVYFINEDRGRRRRRMPLFVF